MREVEEALWWMRINCSVEDEKKNMMTGRWKDGDGRCWWICEVMERWRKHCSG